jgi:biopolymer transport protein ExbD
MESTARDRTGIRSEINITPLVDVCLVLLIIFMVVTPMLNEQIALDLPRVANPDRMPRPASQITISIPFSATGTIFVEKRPLSSLEFRSRLATLRELSPPPEIVVRADRRVAYGRARAVLATLDAFGFREVGLAAEKAGPVTARASFAKGPGSTAPGAAASTRRRSGGASPDP